MLNIFWKEIQYGTGGNSTAKIRLFFDIDDEKEPPIFEKVFYRIKYRIENFPCGIKYGFQKLFRPYHVSDLELWNLDGCMAKMLYPKILAYKKMERYGYPSDFLEYNKNEWKSKDEYENAVKEGKIKGGGPEAWEKVLDEIIFAFEWHLYCKDSIGTDKQAIKFFEKYGYKNPYAETEDTHDIMEIEKRALEGFRLFGEYFTAFWD